jgi:hypothetical protein
LQAAAIGPPVADELLYSVVDALDGVARETGKSFPQIALNGLTGRPTVSSVIVGARDEERPLDSGTDREPGCGQLSDYFFIKDRTRS